MRMLQLMPDGPGKEQSCVVLLFKYRSLFSSTLHCTATPKGVTDALGMCEIQSTGRGIAHSADTSLLNDFRRASRLSGVEADL